MLSSCYNAINSKSASSNDTIYTALKRSQGITNWTFGETGKTIRLYQLVQSCKDLYIRIYIGIYIERSGIDQSWVKSGWFSENTMHQVLSC